MLTVYKASAGSGKTYTLTYEYIKFLLGYKDPDTGIYHLRTNPKEEHQSILAVTFTNKATEEMKRRIIQERALIAEMPSMGDEKSPYLNDLLKLYRCEPQQLRETARIALFQLLFNYTFFNVSTIDSFFQNVLRTFAFEAELDGNYEIELHDSLAFAAGITELLNTIRYKDDAHSQQLSKWMKKYMFSLIDNGKKFNVFNRRSKAFDDLYKFVKNTSNEQFKLLLDDKVIGYFYDSSRIIKFEEKLTTEIDNIITQINDSAKSALSILTEDELNGLNSNIHRPLQKWAEYKRGDEIKDPSNTFIKVGNREQSPFSSEYIKKKTNAASLCKQEPIANAINVIVSKVPRLKLLSLLYKYIYMLGLVGDILKNVKQYREENNLILLSDTNDLLQRIISKEEAPFIYERMGMRLKHFLIDEFQDTSKMQWLNINPLVSESLSNNYDNLIIGDEKQCIYRFRNSDPSLLREQVSREFEGYIIERGDNITENTNWRSSAEVIKFNNTLFSALASILEVNDVYSNVTQQVSAKHSSHHGYVKVEFFDDKDTDKEQRELLALDKMACDIKRQLNSGYKQSDIAILARGNDEGHKIIEYLMKLMANPDADFPKINIISDDSFKIDSSPMVKLILSVLRLINDEADMSSRRSPQHNTKKFTHRYIFYSTNGKSPNEAIELASSKDPLEIDNLLEKVLDMRCLNLPSLVERIIEFYITDKDTRTREAIFLTAFQDEVLDFCSHGKSDINSFLKWWDTPQAEHIITSSTEIDAIRVMTIHKSKGLEFKCVHIPLANWKLAGKSSLKWFKGIEIDGFEDEIVPPVLALSNSKTDLEGTPFEAECLASKQADKIDELNATYVAFTRAIDELCINCIYNLQGNNIATDIKKAFELATSTFCDSLKDHYSEANGELFIPLDGIVDNKILEIGKPTTAIVESDDKCNIPPAERVENCEAAYYFVNSRDDVWENLNITDEDATARARERGIFLHNVMSRVRTPDDLKLALDRVAYRARLDAKEKEEALEILSKAIVDDRVSLWFNNYEKVLLEQSITLKNAEGTYRPDRVVWTSQGTIDVIDYKFGEEHKEQYQKQVKNYMNLLTDMGYQAVRGFLWYVEKGKIVEIK